MRLSILFCALAIGLGVLTSAAQTNSAPRVAVTLMVSPGTAATIADLQSNGVPMDTVIALGSRSAFAKAQLRLRQQLEGMSAEQIEVAYPALMSLVDTNADQQTQWQQLQQLAVMQLSRVHTASEANATAARHLAAIQAAPRPDVDPHAASQQYLQRTNLFEK